MSNEHMNVVEPHARLTCSGFSDYQAFNIQPEMHDIGRWIKERFTVLALARNKSHLDVLEGLLIKHLTPELCAQKEHFRVLQLF